MENCLKVKLLAEVNNPELIILDSIKFKRTTESAGQYERFSVSHIGDLTVDNGKKLYNSYQDATNDQNGFTSVSSSSTGTKTYYFAPGTTYVNIMPKSKIYKLTLSGEFVGGIPEYMTGLTEYNGANLTDNYGDISAFSSCMNLTSLTIADCPKITGTVESLNALSSLKTLSAYNTAIYGSINTIVGLTNLESLYVYGTDVTGEIVTLLNGMVSNGRTSGRLAISGNNKITLNGIVVPNRTYKAVYFGTSMEDKNPTQEETAQGWCIRES